jgi:hypothetical protein
MSYFPSQDHVFYVLFSSQIFSIYRVHSALMRINEELVERKVGALVWKTEINDHKGFTVLTT